MKKSMLMVALAAMLFMGNQMVAQNETGRMMPLSGRMRQSGDEMIKSNVKKLKAELQLTDEQASGIENLYKQQMEARKAQREKSAQSGQRPDMEAMRAAHAAERAELDKKIAQMLTPEQQVKFAELQKKNGHGYAGQKGHGPQMPPEKMKKEKGAKGEGMAERMQKELDLTAEQLAQVKEVLAKQSMTHAADKKKMQDANRENAKQRRAETDKAMQSILTPQQYEKFQQMQQDKQAGEGNHAGKGKKTGHQKRK